VVRSVYAGNQATRRRGDRTQPCDLGHRDFQQPTDRRCRLSPSLTVPTTPRCAGAHAPLAARMPDRHAPSWTRPADNAPARCPSHRQRPRRRRRARPARFAWHNYRWIRKSPATPLPRARPLRGTGQGAVIPGPAPGWSGIADRHGEDSLPELCRGALQVAPGVEEQSAMVLRLLEEPSWWPAASAPGAGLPAAGPGSGD
jgi:hypothetical protein